MATKCDHVAISGMECNDPVVITWQLECNCPVDFALRVGVAITCWAKCKAVAVAQCSSRNLQIVIKSIGNSLCLYDCDR